MPADRVLLEPGVVLAMVAEAADEFKPVLLSFAQTYQPFLALVLTVAVRGVGLAVTEPVARLPRASVLPLRAKENDGATVAVTTIWSLVMVAVAYWLESIGAVTLSIVVTLPSSEALAPDAVVRAALFVQL